MEISGVVIGEDRATGKPVTLDFARRVQGVAIIGATGTGKTTLLERMVLSDIEAGIAVIVIDAHGELSDRIVSLTPSCELDRLSLLELWEDRPFRLNLFEALDRSQIGVEKTVYDAISICKKLFDDQAVFAPTLERWLGNAARTIIPNNGTLADVPRLFRSGALRETYLANINDEFLHDEWTEYERLTRRPGEETRQLLSTTNRLHAFLGPRPVRTVVSSPHSTVPFDEVMDENGVLLIRLPSREISDQLSGFFGALLLTVLTQRVFARPPQRRHRLHLYLDEYGRFATPATADLLTEGRKFGVATTIAHQTRAQITDAKNRAAEMQAGALILFRAPHDADDLAGALDTTPIRTKTVLKQRTTPQYKKWDEEIWTDEEAKRSYEEMERLAKEVRHNGARAAHVCAEVYGSYLELFRGDRHTSQEEVEKHNRFYKKILEDAEPMEYAWVWSSVFAPLVTFFKGDEYWYFRWTRGPYVRADLKDCRNPFCAGIHHAFYLIPSAAEESQLVRRLRLKGYDALARELVAVLEPLYEKHAFWRCDKQSQGDASDWGRGFPPLESRADVDWQAPVFPEAVVWMRKKSAQLKAEAMEWELEEVRLNAQMKSLADRFHRVEHHNKYWGELPVKEDRSWVEARPNYSRYGPDYTSVRHVQEDQWYDRVEELDQTHADRRLEIAKEVARLDDYTAHCKLLNEQGEVQEYRVRTLTPASGGLDMSRVSRVRQRSRERYGLPPEEGTGGVVRKPRAAEPQEGDGGGIGRRPVSPARFDARREGGPPQA